MNVFLRLTLDCEPEVAWRAMSDPEVFRAVSSPLLTITSNEKGGFTQAWTGDGPHEVSMRLLGIIPIGRQTIDVSFTQRPGGVRMMKDSGTPLSGPLTSLACWDHRMAISEEGNGKTLFRDRLVVQAGVHTLFFFTGLWLFWQWRAAKIKKLASGWSKLV